MKNSKVVNSVLQEWVMSLSWKHQTGLISAIRGVDMEDGSTSQYCKTITKMIRYLLLNNTDNKTKFMNDEVSPIDEVVAILNLLHDHVALGILSNHWFDHILLAIKSIIDNHPNPYTRVYWLTVYNNYNMSGVSKVEQVILEESVNDGEMQYTGYHTSSDKNPRVLKYSGDDVLDIPLIVDTNIDESLSSELENVVDSVLKSDIIYPKINEENPIVSDTIDRENYTIHHLEVMRVIDGRAVTYNCINTVKSTQLIFRDMIKVLSQLDAILTNNWDVVNDTMSVNYDLSMPISKGTDMRVRDSNTNEFMVSNLTGDLLYKDALDVVWVIASKLISKDYLYISITRWLGNTDTVVYCLIGYK